MLLFYSEVFPERLKADLQEFERGQKIHALHTKLKRQCRKFKIGNVINTHGNMFTSFRWTLDYEEDLYGKSVALEFVDRIRDEIQYESISLLTDQMHMDVRDTRKILDN